jgi:phenylacetate-CoA ligase
MRKTSFSDPSHCLQRGLGLRTATTAVREEAQLQLLRRHLELATRSPFYREQFGRSGFPVPELRSLADLQALPLTSREDLDREPAAFLPDAADFQPVDLALTSGTTGEAVTIPYTSHDLERLAFNEMMAFHGIGIKPGDRVLLCVTLDRCFIAGLAYYSGLVRLGAAAIRSGPGKPAGQWELIRKLRPTAVVGVPSFLLQLARWGEENGMHPPRAGISALVTIGEPVRKADMTLTALGTQLRQAWGAQLYASYGATELETAFGECAAACGGHVHPELMLVEIIDGYGKPVATGEPGEVVVTPLGVEGFPLVRFRTGDVARLHTSPCGCGWQTPRLGPIEGRLAQRLKYKGTTIYPESIFQTLAEIPGIHAFYVEAHSAFDLADEIRVIVGSDEEIRLEMIQDMLQARLRVRPEVIRKPTGEVIAATERGNGRKLKRFFDFREVN